MSGDLRWNIASTTGGTIAVGGDGLVANETGNAHSTILTYWSISAGKVYFELTLDRLDNTIAFGLAAAGWNSSRLVSTTSVAGQHAASVTNGTLSNAVFIEDGASAGTVTGSPKLQSAGAVLGVALDASAGKLWLRVDGGTWFGGGDPAAGSTPTFTLPTGVAWHAAVSLRDAQATANFGASAFDTVNPSGFLSPLGGEVQRRHVTRYALLQPVSRRHATPYAGPVQRRHVTSYDIIEVPRRRHVTPYALRVVVERRHLTPYSAVVGLQRRHATPYAGPVQRRHVTPYTCLVEQRHATPYALLAPVQRRHATPYAATSPVQRRQVTPYTLLVLNPVRRRHATAYDLSATVLRVITDEPRLTVNGQRLRISAAVLSASEDAWGWSGAVAVPGDVDQALLTRDTPVTLTLGGEDYALLVDSLEASQSGPAERSVAVRLVSPAALHAEPRAARLTRTWSSAVLASTAASEALGGASIDWQMVDWSIPAGRLAVSEAEPIEVARRIVEAAGGVLASGADGALVARPRFAVRVPGWAAASVDQTFTDAADRVQLAESWRATRTVDRVAVRDLAGLDGYLAVEVDARAGGLNGGRTSFAPGETVWLLAYTGPGVQVVAVSLSSGALLSGVPQAVALEEVLSFEGSAEAALAKPAASVQAMDWLGTSLGTATLGADRQTLSVAAAGTALLRVRYTASARAYAVVTPASVAGGETSFPLLAVLDATQADDRPGGGLVNIVAQRGEGLHAGEDVTEPLLGDLNAALARGRAELDAGEALQTVRQTVVFRTGLAPGQLAETHDARQGASWRGLLTAVEHRAEGGSLTTLLEVLRA